MIQKTKCNLQDLYLVVHIQRELRNKKLIMNLILSFDNSNIHSPNVSKIR